jgi:CrcB protein
MRTSIIVFIGAGIGGLMRHVMNIWITALASSGFPYSILTINVIGSTAMGLAAGWFASRGEILPDLRLFLATGILGGFTTFSAFSLDSWKLWTEGPPHVAGLYVLASVGMSFAALAAGLVVARLIWA